MSLLFKTMATGLFALAALGAQAQVAQVKVWAAACANCHGTNGKAQPGMESLAGKDKDDMSQKLLDFKSGRNMPKPVRELLRLVHVEQVDIKSIKREDWEVVEYLKSQEPELFKSLKKSARAHAKKAA